MRRVQRRQRKVASRRLRGRHKLKRLIQAPNSYFMDVKCPGCLQITTVYSNTPFRGPAFQLPSGAVVVEDMWLASLNTTIDEILDEGLDGLKKFADETNREEGWVGKWLKHKVGLEGSDQHKLYYEALARDLWPDAVTPNQTPAGTALETPADYIRAGLPMNMTDMVHQPLQEVEVYRDLGGFELPEEAKPDEDEDDEKKADDTAEGA